MPCAIGEQVLKQVRSLMKILAALEVPSLQPVVYPLVLNLPLSKTVFLESLKTSS